jgi:hypothetical protein
MCVLAWMHGLQPVCVATVLSVAATISVRLSRICCAALPGEQSHCMCVPHMISSVFTDTCQSRGLDAVKLQQLNHSWCSAGVPDSRPLQGGDLLNVDVTAYLEGFHGDTNATFCVGEWPVAVSHGVQCDSTWSVREGKHTVRAYCVSSRVGAKGGGGVAAVLCYAATCHLITETCDCHLHLGKHRPSTALNCTQVRTAAPHVLLHPVMQGAAVPTHVQSTRTAVPTCCLHILQVRSVQLRRIWCVSHGRAWRLL